MKKLNLCAYRGKCLQAVSQLALQSAEGLREAMQNMQAGGEEQGLEQCLYTSRTLPTSCMRWLLLLINAAEDSMFYSVKQKKHRDLKSPSIGEGRGRWADKNISWMHALGIVDPQQSLSLLSREIVIQANYTPHTSKPR